MGTRVWAGDMVGCQKDSEVLMYLELNNERSLQESSYTLRGTCACILLIFHEFPPQLLGEQWHGPMVPREENGNSQPRSRRCLTRLFFLRLSTVQFPVPFEQVQTQASSFLLQIAVR
jgi:hypothetical protein